MELNIGLETWVVNFWVPKPNDPTAVKIIVGPKRFILLLLEKVPQDLFHSVYFEYEENCTHDRLLSLNYAFCHIERLIKTSEPVYVD